MSKKAKKVKKTKVEKTTTGEKKKVLPVAQKEYYRLRAWVRSLTRLRTLLLETRKRMDNQLGLKKDGTKIKRTDVQGFSGLPEEDFDELYKMRCEILDWENKCQAMLENALEEMPIYTGYLKDIKALGAIGSGWICGEFDIYEARTPSSMTQFSGFNPGFVRGMKWGKKNGKKVKVRTDTMVKGDKPTKGFLLPYNKKLRVALIGLIASSLVKGTKPKGVKRVEGVKIPNIPTKQRLEYYDPTKYRLEHSDKEVKHKGKMVPWKDVSDGHRNSAAMRYMMKMFLIDLYKEWRPLYGLEVKAPYYEWKLGQVHHSRPEGEVDGFDKDVTIDSDEDWEEPRWDEDNSEEELTL